MTEAKMQDLERADFDTDLTAPPKAPLAMPKQVLESGQGGMVHALVARFIGLTARSEG